MEQDSLCEGAVYDLVEFAKRLHHGEQRLKWLILSLRDAYSIYVDLKLAEEMIISLVDLLEVDASDKFVQSASLALLQSFIVMYSRATKTSSSQRRTFDFVRNMTDAQKTVHRKICALRDKAVAHFGFAESLEFKWRRDGVFLVEVPSGEFKVATLSRNTLSGRGLVLEFKEQASAVRELAYSRSTALNVQVTDELNAALEKESVLQLLESHGTSLMAFLNNAEAVKAVLAAHASGPESGVFESD